MIVWTSSCSVCLLCLALVKALKVIACNFEWLDNIDYQCLTRGTYKVICHFLVKKLGKYKSKQTDSTEFCPLEVQPNSLS